MKKQKPSWLKGIPIDPSKLTLDELRNFKEADRLLTGPIEGQKDGHISLDVSGS